MSSSELKLARSLRLTRPDVFSAYSVSGGDISLYNELFSEGRDQEAVDHFVEKYMNSPARLYGNLMINYLSSAMSGLIKDEDRNSLYGNVTSISLAVGDLLSGNYKSFTEQAYGKAIFRNNQITSPQVKKAILEASVAQFEDLTRGALTETNIRVLRGIRTMQTEMILENQYLYSLRGSATKVIDAEVDKFYASLEAKYPEIFRMVDEGRILTRNGLQLNPDSYVDMATRTTLLNVDRTAVEIAAKLDEAPAVEYYLRDKRQLKTGPEREICKNILAKKIHGRSILALDEEIGALLEVRTISQARESGAMGPYCRHSIKQLPQEYREQLAKVIFLLKNAKDIEAGVIDAE